MSAISKLEQVVHDALVDRGMSSAEARVVISKLKASKQFSGSSDLEISEDGKLLAIYPVECIGDRPKALFCRHNQIEFWMPKTQINHLSEVQNLNDQGILIVSKWIAEQKGWIKNGKLQTITASIRV